MALVLAVVALPRVAGADPVLTARAALVMDARTGEVIWEQNGNVPMPPASTTKIMTAILAIESGRLDESLTCSAFAAKTAPSRINLRAGQRMRLKNLLYALLLKSANDAATVIAEGVSGTQAAFAGRMTSRARQLGARTAHFKNPHGLTAPGHVASARDLAVIMRHGLKLGVLRDILSTKQVRVPVEARRSYWVSLSSHNRLLTGHTYPVIGKTGYTRAARRCFVGSARSGGREIIIAVLGSRDLWGDSKRLLAFGFGAAEEPQPLVVASAASAPLQPEVAEGDEDDEAPQIGDVAALDPTALNALNAMPEAEQELEPEPEPEPAPEAVEPAPAVEVEEVEEEPEPAPRVRKSKSGRWTIQLGPYKSRSTALNTRSRLKRKGYTAVVAGKSVRLGQFSSRSRADHLARRLRADGYRGTVIALK